ncbi:NAD(P)/FAD-dependent oxidoreductase [Promicromonospora sukumoe]|uniref:NAD(P)/FAD-dependent oxidoreductase n=1 Tax=Promicromonospora sukumoe TaxID=88382 RepID=UPI003654C023
MLSSPVGKDVVVVGAGIVGASVAYHAARAGAAVTLLDAGPAAGGVTRDSFAWIGSSGASTGAAAGLRTVATDEYHRLETELPGLAVTWSGSLTWNTGAEAPVAGPGQEIVDGAAVMRLEPNLRQPPEWALWAQGDGSIDPVAVTERLIADARDHGARVRLETPVTAVLRNDAGRVTGVETPSGPVPGASVVLAAGTGTPALAAPLGVHVPVGPSPATLFRFRAPAGLVRTVVSTQDFDLRQVSPDQLISAADHPDRTLAAIRATFRGADDVQMLSARIGARPMPLDGDPVIGLVTDVPGLYLAVVHPGVTLAPVVGRLVARELIHGAPEPALAGCRPGR